MNIIIDMGTSNLRIYFERNGKPLASASAPLGSKYTLSMPKSELYGKINEIITGLIAKNNITASVDDIYVFGMGGSEYGIYEVPRAKLPLDAQAIAGKLFTVHLPALFDAPVHIIPGACYRKPSQNEIMRGEETEAMGFTASFKEDCVLVLPGSHCKCIRLREGAIVDFCSTMSGEMLQALSENTILKASVNLGMPIDEKFIIRGAECTRKIGINGALLNVRTMENDKYKTTEITSFFIGAVLYNDIMYNLSFAGDDKIYVGGKKELRVIYKLLLERYGANEVHAVAGAEMFGFDGVCEIIRAGKRLAEKAETIEKIKENKIITIIRGLKKEEYLPTLHALYDGGIRFVEVTFDASGRQSDSETAEIIRTITAEFKGKMYIGAGSVLKPSQVRLTKESGGKYIISPNFNPAVVAETKKQALVSIPGCFTPSEAVEAYDFGADFIKIFPNELGGERYIKAITAPLPHIPFLAVGGVNEENLAGFLSKGAVGVGIGSLLIDKQLIHAGNFGEITKRAARCVEAAKSL